jgi:nitrate/nitrite transporter NarK
MLTAAAILVIAGALLEYHTSAAMVLLSLSLCTLAVGIWAWNMHALAADAFSPTIVASAHGIAGSAGAIGGIVFNSVLGYTSSTQQHGVALLLFATLMPLGVAPLWLWLRDPSTHEA